MLMPLGFMQNSNMPPPFYKGDINVIGTFLKKEDIKISSITAVTDNLSVIMMSWCFMSLSTFFNPLSAKKNSI